MKCKKCGKEIINKKKYGYNIELCCLFDISEDWYCDKCLDDAYHASAVASWEMLGEL